MSTETVKLQDGTEFSFNSEDATPYEQVMTSDGIGLYFGEAGWVTQVEVDLLEFDEIEDINYYLTAQDAYDAAIAVKERETQNV